MKEITFKDKTFKVARGRLHPEYSYFTFEEEGEFKNKYWNILPSDVVLDIGASYGAYALTARAMGAKVYAVEPELSIYQDLVTNIEINSFNDKCFAFNVGIWDQPATIHMSQYAPHWSTNFISGAYNMKSLDQLINENNISKLDWIKIDVEGAEEKVIKGGLESIKKLKPKMIIECHTFLDSQLLEKVKQLLIPLNYIFKEEDRAPCKMLICAPF